MRIVHVTWKFIFGGIETMLVNIANEQVALGHEVHIIVIEHNKVEPTLLEKLDSRICLHLVNRKYGYKDILAIIRLNRILTSINPSTIHLHSASIYKYLMPWMKKICNNTLHALCNSSNTDCIRFIPRVFAISQAVAKDLKEKKGVDSIVIPNGIRPEFIKAKQGKGSNLNYKIVQVSRLDHHDKGQDILIEAGLELTKRGYKNFKIFFIGDGTSQTYLESLVKQFELSDKIFFCGAKDQHFIFNHLCDYDLFVQPSRKEGFGLTVAEAMAAKVPILVASGQGPEEVIDYGRCGYVFKNGDVNCCADKIESIMNYKNNNSMIESAYERVYNKYNIKITAQLYINNYIHR